MPVLLDEWSWAPLASPICLLRLCLEGGDERPAWHPLRIGIGTAGSTLSPLSTLSTLSTLSAVAIWVRLEINPNPKA